LSRDVAKTTPHGKRSWKHTTNETPRSLSQKFRPNSFNELLGQNVVVRSLLGAIYKGRITSLYLFHGPRGIGKTSAARIFACCCPELPFTWVQTMWCLSRMCCVLFWKESGYERLWRLQVLECCFRVYVSDCLYYLFIVFFLELCGWTDSVHSGSIGFRHLKPNQTELEILLGFLIG
jgi:hypothetical protein